MEIKEFLEGINIIEEENPITVEEAYESKDSRLDNYSEKIIALAIHLQLNIDEIDDIEKSYGYGNCLYSCGDMDYYCGDCIETIDAVTAYIKDTIWAFRPSFLMNYGILRSLNYTEKILTILQEECDSANDDVLELVDWENNNDKIVQDVISLDGIGHFLNSYDGTVNEITINNTEYTICRS